MPVIDSAQARRQTSADVADAAPPDANVAVALKGVTKTLGGRAVLKNCDLSVAQGELVSILGPSGVGKSTILNVVAGFMPIESGTVELAGKDVTWASPHRRNIGFIFQEYALFPHMSVEGNVRFPLDMRRVPAKQARERVTEALTRVGLESFADRRPTALSGGQRQRVAIARALVFEPEVLLMDEPLSSLDRQLRDSMSLQMRRLQEELGVTVIYVTHDPEEALGLSDRVGVLRDGAITQIGRPEEVHERPRSAYVAELCGSVNLLAGCERLGAGDGPEAPWAFTGLQGAVLQASYGPDPACAPDAELLVGVRPHLLTLAADDALETGTTTNALRGTVTSIRLMGSGLRYEVDLGAERPWQVLAGRAFAGIEPGDQVSVTWNADDTMIVER